MSNSSFMTWQGTGPICVLYSGKGQGSGCKGKGSAAEESRCEACSSKEWFRCSA